MTLFGPTITTVGSLDHLQPWSLPTNQSGQLPGVDVTHRYRQVSFKVAAMATVG